MLFRSSDITDGRVRQWVVVQAQALKRMDSLSKRLGTLERKQKWLHSLLATKTVKSPGKTRVAKPSKHGESRALRDKLDAIRSMEERMDETGEGD